MQDTFSDKLIKEIKQKKSILCLGIDPNVNYLPKYLKNTFIHAFKDKTTATLECFLEFYRIIIEEIKDLIVSAKIQSAFFEQYGSKGIKTYEKIIKILKNNQILVISDVKRNDGGDSAKAYANTYLGQIELLTGDKIPSSLQSDALTLNIQIGSACLDPFLIQCKNNQKGIFALVKTSFQPESVFESLTLDNKTKYWEKVAQFINQQGKQTIGNEGYANLGAVVGARQTKEARLARKLMPKTWFLVPGYQFQGISAETAVSGIDKNGLGIIVNSGRGLITSFLKSKLKNDQGFEKIIKQTCNQSREELNLMQEKMVTLLKKSKN